MQSLRQELKIKRYKERKNLKYDKDFKKQLIIL